MSTRTSLVALILLSGISASNVVSAQNSYHRPIRHIQAPGSSADSVDVSTHLQVNLFQPDKSILKFRIAVLNPQGRSMAVTILKGDEVFFSDMANGEQYYNIFNMAQMEDGDYDVIVTGGKERVVRHIHMETSTTVDRQTIIN